MQCKHRYPLEASHHMVCLCTLYRVCVVYPGTSELVGQHHKECLDFSTGHVAKIRKSSALILTLLKNIS